MEFKRGAKVYTREGETAGQVDRVVIEPGSKQVTHLVLTKGFLFPQEKMIPVNWVESATQAGIQLDESADSVEEAPDFTELAFVYAEEPQGDQEPAGPARLPRPVYWYPPIGTPWWGYSGPTGRAGFFSPSTPRYTVRGEHPIPEGTIPLKEGAHVISSDGEQVGNAERIYTEPVGDRVTHLVISSGLLLPERKAIPSLWIADIDENEIHLSVSADVLQRLEAHEEDPSP